MLPALHPWYAHAVGCRWCVHAVGSRYTALVQATTVTARVFGLAGTQHWLQLPPSQHWSKLPLSQHGNQATTVTAWQSSNSRQCCGLRTLSIVIWPFFFPFSHHSLSFHIILITILHHLGCSYKFHNWFPPPKTKKSVVPFLFTSLGNHNVCCFALSLFLLLCLPRQHK